MWRTPLNCTEMTHAGDPCRPMRQHQNLLRSSKEKIEVQVRFAHNFSPYTLIKAPHRPQHVHLRCCHCPPPRACGAHVHTCGRRSVQLRSRLARWSCQLGDPQHRKQPVWRNEEQSYCDRGDVLLCVRGLHVHCKSRRMSAAVVCTIGSRRFAVASVSVSVPATASHPCLPEPASMSVSASPATARGTNPV